MSGNKTEDKNLEPFKKEILTFELKYNKEVFLMAHELFFRSYEKNFKVFNELTSNRVPFISDQRLHSMLRAVTHDLLRYAQYQRISFNEETNRYKICQSVRAAVFTKWVMMLRPYSLDVVSSEKYYDNEVYFCNEFAAIYCASVAMSDVLPLDSNNNPKTLFDILEESELEVMLYHLRYRIKHQDTYSLFYRRIKEQNVHN